MSDPTVIASVGTLPTQLLAAAPSWYWRYGSVVVLTFLAWAAADGYLGGPVVSWIRSYAAQKVEAVKNPALTQPLNTIISPQMAARIDSLEHQSVQLLSDVADLTTKMKAVEATLQYTVGRIGTLEGSPVASSAPKVKPKPKAAVIPPPAPTPVPVDAGPVAKMP